MGIPVGFVLDEEIEEKAELPKGFVLDEPETAFEPERNNGNLRTDGTEKGQGYFGKLQRPDGKVSTELSIGVDFDGKETEIPSLVPTLKQDEINYLLEGNEPTEEIVNKASEHAKRRMAGGRSPFAEEFTPTREGMETRGFTHKEPELPSHPLPPEMQPERIAEIRSLTPPLKERQRELRPGEEDTLKAIQEKQLKEEFPTDYYTGGSKSAEAWLSLLTAGLVTRNIALPMKAMKAYPELKKMIDGALSGGSTFGLDAIVENIAKYTKGEEKDISVLVKDTLARTGFGALLGGILSVPASVRASNWWRMESIKGRGLVVQSVADLRKAGYTEGQISRMKPEHFKEWSAKTGKGTGEAPFVPLSSRFPKPEGKPEKPFEVGEKRVVGKRAGKVQVPVTEGKPTGIDARASQINEIMNKTPALWTAEDKVFLQSFKKDIDIKIQSAIGEKKIEPVVEPADVIEGQKVIGKTPLIEDLAKPEKPGYRKQPKPAEVELPKGTEDMMVEIKGVREKTGKEFTTTETAKEAFSEVSERIKRYKSLRDCI